MKNRYGLLWIFTVLSVIVSNTTRISLILQTPDKIDFNLFELLKIFTVGSFYDLVAISYLVAFFAFYLLIIPQKYFASLFNKIVVYLVFTSATIGLIFNGFSEWFFWEEFKVKFNFIAVDYLVYTHEVIGNIKESYPLGKLFIAIFIISFIVMTIVIKYNLIGRYFIDDTKFSQRLKVFLFTLAIPIITFFVIPSNPTISQNQYNNELAKNGYYSLFSAFRNNKLNYNKFYISLPKEEMLGNLRAILKTNDSQFIDQNLSNITRNITSKGEELKPNVILIMVESLSAEFLGTYGNTQNLTPNLDKLAKESLFFNNLYASGTRTVRGMEAVTLSVPPTPGSSMVKRPDSADMFSAGFVFANKGYENHFIYGGYGYFDNMNAFFGSNGFTVVDRNSFTKEESTYGNVWGLCDGDVFDKTLKIADNSYNNKKPFFNYIMTTSNHRPFTYPDGKIDIPSKTGREGAVKYTDYAIGDFINKAKTKPWFKNTVFVIVADHCANSAGKSELPIEKYKIPLIIYAPNIIKPQIISKMASQIDTIPTLLANLNWNYQSKFYGQNILASDFQERAIFGTYQKLGYFKDNHLSIIEPQNKYSEFEVNQKSQFDFDYKEIPTIIKQHKFDIITTYQSASYLYDNKLNRK